MIARDVQNSDSTSESIIPMGILQITTPSPLPNGFTGRQYSFVSFSAIGSPGPFTWSTPTPPPGLTLTPSGILSGTPTAFGNFTFTVTAQDNTAGASVFATYSLSVVAVLYITTSSPLPSAMVGAKYSQALSAANGTLPYSYSLTTGIAGNSPPPGLALSSGGTISGTPTAAGLYLFNVTVTDGASNQASTQLSLTITPALVILTNSLNSGTVGTSYSQTISASGGTSPYTFTSPGTIPAGLTLSTAGLLNGTPKVAGTSTVSIQVADSTNFTVSKQFLLAIAGVAPSLQVSPTQISFTAAAGGDSPVPQAVTILSNTGKPVSFAAQIIATNGQIPSWLSISPATGTAPGALLVSANPAGLTASPAAASIQISVPGDQTQSPIPISVSLTLSTANPQLQTTPPSLRFTSRVQSPTTLEQLIAITNPGGGGSLGFTTSILQQSSWITSVTPSAGQTSTNTPVVLRVDVNTQGLSVGTHQDVIHFATSAGSVNVPVSLFVADQGPILGLNVSGLRFPARQGIGTTMPRTVTVQNLGDPASTLNWSAVLQSGSEWLTISPASGTASSSNPGTLTLTPSSASANFSGPRYALVDVSDNETPAWHQYLTAVLDVQPASTPPLPELSPAGLLFTASGSTGSAAQTVKVFTSSSTPVSFLTAVSTTDGANWLTANTATATSSTQAPGVISISVSPTGLAPGIYSGAVNVSMSGALRSVNVTLIVLPAGVTPHVSEFHPQATTGCTPSKLAVTQTSLANHFAVPAGWPATLVVQLTDDCGNAVTNGAAVASFSNGDPPLSLSGDNVTPLYSATWQPGTVLQQMTVSIRATAPSTLAGTAQLAGSISNNPATPPSLYANGTLDIFFNADNVAAVGDGLAPGSVAQVYGTGLAPAGASPGTVPLQTQFNGTFMLVGGLLTPLFYISPGLVNVQIPFELAPNRQYPIVVSSNGALTVPQTIDVVTMQPGVLYSIGSGAVIAQHSADYSLVTAASPAKPGENLIIYLTGMGPTNPSVASGNPTPLQSVLATTQPTVTVDGQQAIVGYGGLTPTGIGLYQINFTVPNNARPGNLNLVVTQGGISANTTTLPVGGN